MSQAIAPFPLVAVSDHSESRNQMRTSATASQLLQVEGGVAAVGEARTLDLDGDGQISQAEVVAAARQQRELQQTGKRLRVTIGIISAVSIAIIGALLGLVVLANEISKDVRPITTESGQSAMVDNSGNVASTSVFKQTADNLTILATLPQEALEEVHRLLVPNGSMVLSYKVSGYQMSIEEPAVTFFTLRQHEIFITESYYTVFAADGTELPLLEYTGSPSRRRLMCGSFGGFSSTFGGGFGTFGGGLSSLAAAGGNLATLIQAIQAALRA
mmetsp:Transcript_28836/g.73948  ORF Transcript_28836/g.73948 Transcript_28836/m.73948 type:complete len:272 (-) Transcript_28836:576-1391(-)